MISSLYLILVGIVLGIALTVHCYIKFFRVPATELWFFPDQKLPCISWDGNRTPFARCRRNACTYSHEFNDASSLMKIIQTLKGAKRIDLCMYRFTLHPIGNLLIHLKQRGTKIRIITDNAREQVDSNQIPRMREAGVEVRERDNSSGLDDKSRPLMHNKFVIIDNKCCLLGSFNWTFAGVTRNQESVIKSHEKQIIKTLNEKFNEMWNELR